MRNQRERKACESNSYECQREGLSLIQAECFTNNLCSLIENVRCWTRMAFERLCLRHILFMGAGAAPRHKTGNSRAAIYDERKTPSLNLHLFLSNQPSHVGFIIALQNCGFAKSNARQDSRNGGTGQSKGTGCRKLRMGCLAFLFCLSNLMACQNSNP